MITTCLLAGALERATGQMCSHATPLRSPVVVARYVSVVTQPLVVPSDRRRSVIQQVRYNSFLTCDDEMLELERLCVCFWLKHTAIPSLLMLELFATGMTIDLTYCRNDGIAYRRRGTCFAQTRSKPRLL